MIASWMLYALAVSALLTIAAFGAERVLAAWGRPVRFVWAGAAALSVLWPIAPALARLLPTPPTAVKVLPFTIVVATPSVISADEAAAIARALFVDRVLIGAWIIASAVLIAGIVRGALRLEALRRGWKRGRVNGVRVQVSENVGPAVVGLRTMDVVVPEWILSLDAPLRAIVLRHEEEHRRARDPYFLFGATLLAALLPWNVALWIQARRLRLGIEMDCDARVLRAHPSPERYGMLILAIAQRGSAAPVQFAPMLSEPKTNLERRILAMRTTKVARATAIGGGLVTVGVLMLASSLQSAPTSFGATRTTLAHRVAAAMPAAFAPAETIPVRAKPTAPRPGSGGAGATQEVRKLDPSITMGGAVARPVENPSPRYPDLLRAAEVEGAVVARFAFDARGAVDPASITIATSTNDALTSAVRDAVRGWHGAPNTALQVPFVFVLDDKTGKDLASYPGGLPAGSVVVTAAPLSQRALAERALTERLAAAAAGAPTAVNENQTYFEFQVERQVTGIPGNPPPRYPDDMRAAGVEGEVLAQFVVGTDGAPDMSTFKVLKSTNGTFTDAVLTSLATMKFKAAEVGGKKVKQLVQMPFQFNLSKTP